ncbi:hypothetical protein E2986_02341 [Frieseomelitta varia]|uniref:Tether containing UBX domain for GLUT4 n=1 Tax=Frieseomelitta varia TaxID=561572 RepID=A0A833RWV6_9HYME|nr:hypothetical protein E2986_02341 [Frieseomelitta varia]
MKFTKTILHYVMIFQISGSEALKNTTLKSLGLINGKAVLRLIQKRPRTVDNVNIVVGKIGDSKVNKNFNIYERNSETATDTNKTLDSAISKKKIQNSGELEICSQDKEKGVITEKEKETNIVPSISTDNCEILPCKKHETDDLNNIEFLGERNALVFNQAAIQGTFRDELPDDFYDLTVDDAKILLRDVKRYRKELEEAPLLTNVQRQSNKEKRTSDQLNKYHYTIIRIQFPDQFVLQGLFQPMETVQAIKDFVKCYLNDVNIRIFIIIKNTHFSYRIVTTPPKHILNSNARLIDENLVPCAIVHYSGSSALKLDVKQKFTDPKKVELQVANTRKLMINQEMTSKDENVNNDTSELNMQTSNESLNEKKSKIPKWLNPSFK